MVFSDQLIPSRGQEYHDRVRCVELQKLGLNVYTVDDKHEDDYLFPGKHCNANFNNDSGFLKNIQNKLGNDISLVISYWTTSFVRLDGQELDGCLPSIRRQSL